MTRALALTLLAAVALAGCGARGSGPDLFAYTKKPLYVGTLALSNETHQNFYVEDGSIGAIHARVWINATNGSARLDFLDPSGRLVWSATQTSDSQLPMSLGEWTVRATPDAGTSGFAGIVVTRA